MDDPRDVPPVHAAEVQALRCADCARAESTDPTAVPVDRMPIPADALAGFPDGVPRARGMDRRAFLRNGILGVASIYAATRIDWTRAFEAAVAEAADPANQLVMIYLNGGLDGINVFVPNDPAEYAAYQAARPDLHRALNTPSVAGGRVGSTAAANANVSFANLVVSGTGNNGDTKGLDTLWGDGTGGAGSDLAYWPGVHFLPANQSHFEATDHIFTGSLRKVTTGWLGRWLDAYGSTSNPLQAVSIGNALSKQIRTASAPTCAVASLGNFGFSVSGVSSADADVNAEVGRLVGAPAGTEALARSRGVYGLTVNVAGQLRAVAAPGANPDYPASSLSDRLKTAATILAAGLGTRVVTIDWGSFDTHGGQAGGMDPQLPILSRALAAFRNDLAARGIEQRVITVVFTEFGRRVAENGSDGTDHGAGGPCIIIGSRVRGGMAGAHPSLTSLDRGNLRVTTDFRTIWGAIVGD
ncbi:MAG: DUF1501 domain-containing protein [Actinomycetota bacterium]